MTLQVTVNIPLLREHISKVEEEIQGVIRPATQAMAQVYYTGLLLNYDRAGIGTVTGNLRGSIYQAFRKERSTDWSAAYAVSWAGIKSAKASQHAHLIEYGHWQLYQVVRGKNGQLVTAVWPHMQGKPKPKRSASQAEKFRYYIPRADGPKWVNPKPFMRPTADSVVLRENAVEAAKKAVYGVLNTL